MSLKKCPMCLKIEYPDIKLNGTRVCQYCGWEFKKYDKVELKNGESKNVRGKTGRT